MDGCSARPLILLDDPSRGLGSLTTKATVGEVSIPRKHWVGEYPTQALGNRQVAPHERCRAQRGRSEALAKRVFINTQVLQFAV